VHVLHRVAQTLVERETLEGEEFAEIVRASGPVAVDRVPGMRALASAVP
jgi:hypothetical protein